MHCARRGPDVPQRSIRIENPGGVVSAYVAKWSPHPKPCETPLALDIPCGRGRHAFYLAALGYDVVAIDNDPRPIEHLAKGLALEPSLSVRAMIGDVNEPLPIERGIFDLVVTTHFVSAPLFHQLPHLFRPGGLFIYESFRAHGENWRSLPKKGEIRDKLDPNFHLLDYWERSAGPADNPTVVVRAIAKKR